METGKSEKQELLDKLNELIKKQSQFQQEINELEKRIINLSTTTVHDDNELKKETDVEAESATKNKEVPNKVHPLLVEKNTKLEKLGFGKKLKEYSPNLEKFIGENLISKIGIAVLIIGVGIGTKYAIDNDLISPLVRIILGYLVGFILTFFALRLKKRYFNFSAVLFSGAMAIHYFITYAAYTYYGFYPNALAFSLMVLITVLTVGLALYYDRQVIAHFGLAGAYIIPFLLKDPDSSVLVLLIYMSIINCGILFISTRKRWKPLNYLALISTWVIFMSWFSSKNYDNELGLSLTFSSLFFALFYMVFLSYKLILKEKFRIDDIIFLLLNSGTFYTVGIISFEIANLSKEYAGLFTITNAAIYGFSSWLIYRSEKKGKLFYWTMGLVILFFTVTIPIQFNTYIIAIIWSVETAMIFLYAKSKRNTVYEYISYLLTLITAIVTLTNWSTLSYNLYQDVIEKLHTPILNREFLSSCVVILSFCFIWFVNWKSKVTNEKGISKLNFFDITLPLLVIFIIYFSFFTQISLYWNNIHVYTSFEITSGGFWEKQFNALNPDINSFMSLWLINYSLLFTSLLSFGNFRWFKNKNFDAFILVINFIMILLFLTAGFNHLSQLRASYLSNELPANYDVSINHLTIRYISLAFFALILYSNYRFVITRLHSKVLHKISEIILCASIVWVASSELINWLKLSGSTDLYKHGLSILWGLFSLILIVYGIWKKKKHIRISAIALIGITLIKLFFYDLTNLKTIPKTIVFVSIGILFLIISFLYNKYKNTIFSEN